MKDKIPTRIPREPHEFYPEINLRKIRSFQTKQEVELYNGFKRLLYACYDKKGSRSKMPTPGEIIMAWAALYEYAEFVMRYEKLENEK